MNDTGYDTSIKFNGSYTESSILYTADYDTLLNLKIACEQAFKFHTKENNQSQIRYFREALNLVNKRLREIGKREGELNMGILNETEKELLEKYDYNNCPCRCIDCEEKCWAVIRRKCVDRLKEYLDIKDS
jgi:hypothetical protein